MRGVFALRRASMRRIRLLALAALPLLSAAHAVDKPARLGLCASCHGENGHATTPGVPNLAGQNLEYLHNAIKLYQSGARDVAAMRAAAGMLAPAELDQVLEWYAQTPAPGAAPP
jgi:cytochrome c553